MTTLDVWKDALDKVGWFIPPYMQMGVISRLAGKIISKGNNFTQEDLEEYLAVMYNSIELSAMVMERYPIVPFIKDYAVTISEAVEAHFLGLDHVAVGGLIPVIEGAGRELAAQRNIKATGIKEVFRLLAKDCREDSAKNNIGNTGEVASMMNSFAGFTDKYFYEKSQNYPLIDNTNRHGILHGAYKDNDYGTPLNFYKTIAAVDILSFISSFRANISWMGVDPTPRSLQLMQYYETLKAIHGSRKVVKP